VVIKLELTHFSEAKSIAQAAGKSLRSGSWEAFDEIVIKDAQRLKSSFGIAPISV
jgi:hypothetical protein